MQELKRKIWVVLDIKGATREDILRNIALLIKKAGIIDNEEGFLKKIMVKGILESCVEDEGIAFLEVFAIAINSAYAFLLCRLQEPVLFDLADSVSVKIVLVSLCRDKSDLLYLKPALKLSKLIKNKQFLEMFLKAKDTTEISAAFATEGLKDQ